MYEQGLGLVSGYENQAMEKQACVVQEMNRTVGENIDRKIAMLRAEIERLEESKKGLAPLMSMRIRDIREAMSY